MVLLFLLALRLLSPALVCYSCVGTLKLSPPNHRLGNYPHADGEDFVRFSTKSRPSGVGGWINLSRSVSACVCLCLSVSVSVGERWSDFSLGECVCVHVLQKPTPVWSACGVWWQRQKQGWVLVGRINTSHCSHQRVGKAAPAPRSTSRCEWVLSSQLRVVLVFFFVCFGQLVNMT